MYAKCLPLLLLIAGVWCGALPVTQDAKPSDLATAETSAKLLNLGGLFGQGSSYPGYNYPNYGYGNSYNGYNRPNTGYYPSTGYYPNNNYGGSGYYPSTGGSYYPNSGSGYYPSSGGGYYPNSGSSGFYPSTGNGYYPTTNILGNSGYGGYGGYGGNGGLRQYTGYWQPDYSGQRNRGYGYYEQTDRYGLPASRDRDNYRDRSNSYGGYRGYD